MLSGLYQVLPRINRHLVGLEALKIVERVKGIEPSLSAWEGDNGGMTIDESGALFSIRNDWQQDWRTLEGVRVE